MSLEVKDETKLRFSDASTVDIDFSSDDELYAHKEVSTNFNPSDANHLLEPILPEVEENYLNLKFRLLNILGVLDMEIEPVCIREEKCLSAASISLVGITRSSLCRRRSTLTQAV